MNFSAGLALAFLIVCVYLKMTQRRKTKCVYALASLLEQIRRSHRAVVSEILSPIVVHALWPRSSRERVEQSLFSSLRSGVPFLNSLKTPKP